MKYKLLSILGYFIHLLVDPLLRVTNTLLSYGRLQALRQKGHSIAFGVKLGHHADILVVGNGKISIGEGTEIAAYSQIVVEDGADLRIGANCFFSRNLFLGCQERIVIGDRVAVGGYATILDVNKRYEDADRPIIGQGHHSAPITIEADVWMGGNVTVLAGSYVGAHSVIGAGSLVRGTIEALSVAVGVPARMVRRIGE